MLLMPTELNIIIENFNIKYKSKARKSVYLFFNLFGLILKWIHFYLQVLISSFLFSILIKKNIWKKKIRVHYRKTKDCLARLLELLF